MWKVLDRSTFLVPILAATTSLCCWTFSTTTVACDDDTANNNLADSTTDDTDDTDNDPYANLPDQDEDTTCSICNTFRQGPCRPYWRKLERCFKDHDEDPATKCVRYFRPHSHCLMEYNNLYQLISLEQQQSLVQDAQKATMPEEWRNFEAAINWSVWRQFVKEEGITFRQTRAVKDKSVPLWKRLPDNTEPVLLTLTCPLTPTSRDGMLLKIAFATDQDGKVLGFYANQAYLDLLKEASKTTTTTTSDEVDQATTSDSETASRSGDTSATSDEASPCLEFFLLPGETRHVRICVMYAENPVHADPNKDLLDICMFQSPYYSVLEAAR